MRPIIAVMPAGEAELRLEAPAPARARGPGIVRPTLGWLADLPPVCIACRARIGSHGLLCGTCFAKIDFIASYLRAARRSVAL